MRTGEQSKTQAALIKAVTMICRPLIRLLIEKGMSFPQFRELVKEIYVDVADQHFSLDGKSTSDSRIFVLTGIHRKDIKRIRQQAANEGSKVTSTASLSAEIIARWSSMPEYLDDRGKPRSLSKRAPAKDCDGDTTCFESLVSSVNKDVRPKVILEEWLRLNIVRVRGDEVILNQSAFVTNKEFKEMAYYLGHNVHDHLASCVNNILQQDKPMLERSVYYASLTENSVDKLNKIASKKGDELLQQLNRQAIKFHDADKHKEGADFRMRLGVYWYQTRLDKGGNDEQVEISEEDK